MGRKHHGRGGSRKGPVRSQRQPGLIGTVHVRERGSEVETAEGAYRLDGRGSRTVMEGDRVYVGVRRGPRGRRVAVVEHVVERAQAGIVGAFRQAGPLGAVHPLDKRIRADFFVLPEDASPARLKVQDGDIVQARILTYPSAKESGVVTLERRIGDESAPDLGVRCVMARYGLADGYPQAAVGEAGRLELDVSAALAGPLRRDARDRFVMTIDPVDARDFDDAVSVERTPSGGWFLGVHIADVSHYVAWDSAVDLEARRRSTSVYLADRVLPMLPEALCNNLCSLRPDEDRLAFTVDMELDARGRVRGYEMYPSVIRSRLRTDYGTVDRVLKGGEAPEATGHAPAEVAAFLHAADELAHARRRVREARGAIDFDTVELHALLDPSGIPVELKSRRRTDATSLVEEAMLLANECVAEYLADRDIDTAYRVHEQPSPDSLSAAARVLMEIGAIGHDRALGITAGDPHQIARALEEAEGAPTEPLVNALLLRAQQRALYRAHNEGHYALGARAYCHFTSPIRRYPDLMVHRTLKVALAREKLGKKAASELAPLLVGTGRECQEGILPQLCRAASAAERTADAAATATQKVKVAQYYAARIGERASGAVSWISDLGAFVRLDGTDAEGLVRMADIGAGEWFDYDAVRLRLVGSSTGRVIELGQRVVVEIASADVMRGRLDFKLVHGSSTPSTLH